jgi:hypothetical protein
LILAGALAEMEMKNFAMLSVEAKYITGKYTKGCSS